MGLSKGPSSDADCHSNPKINASPPEGRRGRGADFRESPPKNKENSPDLITLIGGPPLLRQKDLAQTREAILDLKGEKPLCAGGLFLLRIKKR